MFLSRYGRQVKIPYHQKDYLSTDIENGDLGDNSENSQRPPGQVYPVYQSRRGRPPGLNDPCILLSSSRFIESNWFELHEITRR